ncbi:hypothetical protein BMS3Bbin12_01219 [bacterium BMS3Bbin12]|nr:hypothetical protein BMS3Bbin12_01219 [bacterium BMS3Bbin12]GBE50117.1 hypothetical protein BMS3Bbin13_01046 [bacterium BMS3Bbin13]
MPLVDALQRVAQANRVMALHTVVVDAPNAETAKFYAQFAPLPGRPLKPFLPMDDRY